MQCDAMKKDKKHGGGWYRTIGILGGRDEWKIFCEKKHGKVWRGYQKETGAQHRPTATSPIMAWTLSLDK